MFQTHDVLIRKERIKFYSPILSSQTAKCGPKPNKITKITQQSNVADFNIFIIIVIRKIPFNFLNSFFLSLVSGFFTLSKTFLFCITAEKEKFSFFINNTISSLLCFIHVSFLSQKIFHYDGSINPLSCSATEGMRVWGWMLHIIQRNKFTSLGLLN